MKEIQLCHCGCGQPTSIARQSNTKSGWVKGQPLRFITGHHTTQPRASLDGLALQPGTRAIPLTQGQVAIVDAADYEYLSQWKWYARKGARTFYAGRKAPMSKGKRGKEIQMHQMIAGNGSDQVDHIDGDGLNNTRANLRPATNQQNQFNQRIRKNNNSGYKGVNWATRDKVWVAKIRVDGKRKHLGTFATAEEGALAYDVAARKYHGEFCATNFKQEG